MDSMMSRILFESRTKLRSYLPISFEICIYYKLNEFCSRRELHLQRTQMNLENQEKNINDLIRQLIIEMQDPVQRRHFSVHGASVQHLCEHPHYRVQVQPPFDFFWSLLVGGGGRGRRRGGSLAYQLGQLQVHSGSRLTDT